MRRLVGRVIVLAVGRLLLPRRVHFDSIRLTGGLRGSITRIIIIDVPEGPSFVLIVISIFHVRSS